LAPAWRDSFNLFCFRFDFDQAYEVGSVSSRISSFSRTGVTKLLNNWIKNWDNSVFVLAIKSL
jgi:hypothetical protein